MIDPGVFCSIGYHLVHNSKVDDIAAFWDLSQEEEYFSIYLYESVGTKLCIP